MAPSGTRAPPREPAPGDPFNIIYSSGTTGTPKGIVHSHAMRWRQFAPTAASYLAAGLPARSLASTPLYSNTTMVGFLAVLLAGGTVTIMGRFDAARWLARAEETRATIAMLVPVQYQRLLAEPSFDRADLSALRLKYCTSAPFAAELKREVLARMPGALIEIYSMTEGGVVCLLHAHEFPNKLHTVGRPAPGSALKVLSEDGSEAAPGEAGELVGRSQTMMSGYRNRPEATRESYWTDPATGETWQRMGDIGRVDADGFVELVGRAKDVIISGGFNIYPVDLEAELEKEPAVVEAAVIGVPSERWGETPVGFVVLRDHAADPQAILAAVNARLGKTQRLSGLHAIAEMPRSHIGKLLKTPTSGTGGNGLGSPQADNRDKPDAVQPARPQRPQGQPALPRHDELRPLDRRADLARDPGRGARCRGELRRYCQRLRQLERQDVRRHRGDRRALACAGRKPARADRAGDQGLPEHARG